MSTCAVLFAKNPEPGKVKTRLQAHMGAETAARLYRAFLVDCATVLEATKAEVKVVAFTPVDAGMALRELLQDHGDFTYVPQPEIELGGRMASLIQWSFARGGERVVLIGSDVPSLPVEYVDRALDLLVEREVVLGPSTDGGYYLIGQRRGTSRIFDGVSWSTGEVLEQTLDRLDAQSLGLLPPWYDVDTAQEVGFLKVHLEALVRAGGDQGQQSLGVLRELALQPPF